MLEPPLPKSFKPSVQPIRSFHLDTVSSTMEAARELAKGLDWVLVTARRQTRGRGTQGRSWISPAGNLYMTMAIGLDQLDSHRIQTLALETGLVLHGQISAGLEQSPDHRLWIKWPNDLLWDEGKVAGLLLEATSTHILIGVGVNLTSPPLVEDGGRPSISLSEAGWRERPVQDLALALSEALQRTLIQPWGLQAKQKLLSDWSGLTRWDSPLVLRDKPEGAMAWPLRLDPDGHLWVRLENGEEFRLVAEYLW